MARHFAAHFRYFVSIRYLVNLPYIVFWVPCKITDLRFFQRQAARSFFVGLRMRKISPEIDDSVSIWFNQLFLDGLPLSRVNALNSRSVVNIGNRPIYKMMGRYSALGPITHWWAALRPLAPLHTEGSFCSLWSYYTLKGRFAAYFHYLIHIRNLVHLPWS